MPKLGQKSGVADCSSSKRGLPETPSYKENPLRRAQKVLECCNGFPVRATLRILHWTRQIPAQSELAQKLQETPDDITPDDITLAGLEIYMLNLKTLASGGQPKAVRGIDIGTVLDVLDGAYARATGQAKEFGAVTDVIADRFGELYGVWLLSFQLEKKMQTDDRKEVLIGLRDGLVRTMVLSTIVKSIAEIYGAKIPEHSEAGMKVRRQKLVRWFRKLKRGEEVNAILKEMQQLNEVAVKIASARLKGIGEAIENIGSEQVVARISKSGSAARVEALKLVANVLLVDKVVPPVLFKSGEFCEDLAFNIQLLGESLRAILPAGDEYNLQGILGGVIRGIEGLFSDEEVEHQYMDPLKNLFSSLIAINERLENL